MSLIKLCTRKRHQLRHSCPWLTHIRRRHRCPPHNTKALASLPKQPSTISAGTNTQQELTRKDHLLPSSSCASSAAVDNSQLKCENFRRIQIALVHGNVQRSKCTSSCTLRPQALLGLDVPHLFLVPMVNATTAFVDVASDHYSQVFTSRTQHRIACSPIQKLHDASVSAFEGELRVLGF